MSPLPQDSLCHWNRPAGDLPQLSWQALATVALPSGSIRLGPWRLICASTTMTNSSSRSTRCRGIERNALQIRDAIMAMPEEPGPPRLVLVGYSKGMPDILEAVVRYPEIHGRIAAVLSAAGAVRGSALANDAEQEKAALLRHWPGAKCDEGDGGGVASLRPDVRLSWMAQNPLPPALRYYSLVTLPTPDRVSRIIEKSYRKLGESDWRNDSQVIYSDQIIPGSTLLGFLNADHWAIAVPVNRSHSVISRSMVDKNDYPREALLEAVLRFIEEDLAVSRQ